MKLMRGVTLIVWLLFSQKKQAIWEAMLQESAFDSIVQSFPLYQLNEQDSKANFFLARIELM